MNMRSPSVFGSIVRVPAMKYFGRAAVVLAALLVLLVPSAPSAQQQQPKTFQLAFCNVSAATPIWIAIMHRKDASKWAVEGWYPLLGTGCSILGSFQLDTFYFYAFGIRNNRWVVWSPADGDQSASTQCVDRDQAFTGVLGGTPDCPKGQVAVRFRKLQLKDDTQAFTFTLRD